MQYTSPCYRGKVIVRIAVDYLIRATIAYRIPCCFVYFYSMPVLEKCDVYYCVHGFCFAYFAITTKIITANTANKPAPAAAVTSGLFEKNS